MVKLNRIYTRTGDDGGTGLVGGERVTKDSLRVAAYGEVDEANACVGLARLHTATDAELDAILARIQNDLFDLGADLATADLEQAGALRVIDPQVERLEREIDGMNADLAPLSSFVLPGGSAAAAALHLARTVSRRAERTAVALSRSSEESVNPAAIRYLNRLSDLLFVAARRANANGASDVLWTPGATREDQGRG
ncbi:MAG TPA: cob(I)yrinic acid a,c-diamide adenosyltransferase [Caulobacteraceae bacterium]